MHQVVSHRSVRFGASPSGGTPGARAIGVWLALLAIAIQCLVVQPHVDRALYHFDVATHASASAADAGNPVAPGEAPAACIVCQAGLIGGAGVLPDTLSVPPAAYAQLGSDIAPASAPLRRTASHDWRSRAPPVAILI